MALIVADRVKETSTSIGADPFALNGASSGFVSFSAAIGNGNTTYYAIVGQTTNQWEVGLGTYSSNQLDRTTVLSNSSGGTGALNFSGGTKDVFVTYPSKRSVFQSASGVIEFFGTSLNLSSAFSNAAETVTVTGTGAGGTINFDVTTQSVLDYSAAASSNFTVNFRGNSGRQLNAILGTGQCITLTLITTQGGTAFYNTSITIDGSTSVVTKEWQNGTIPSFGNANSDDIYTYTILKTASSTFTVYASQTRYA